MIRLHGIVVNAVMTLIIASALVVVCTLWWVQTTLALRERQVALQDIRNRVALRSQNLDASFATVGDDVSHCQQLLAQALQDPPQDPALGSIGIDGALRLMPTDQLPIAAFATRSAAGQETVRQEIATARQLLRAHAQHWCRAGGSLWLASPDRWYVGYGAEAVELVATMLPDDPVILSPDRAFLSEAIDRLRWTPSQLEPASGQRFIGAISAVVHAEHLIAIQRQWTVDAVLAHALGQQPTGTTSFVFDHQHQILARNDGRPYEGRMVDIEHPARAALMRLVSITGPSAEVIQDPDGHWVLGVSRLAGPDWCMVTIYPPALLDAAAEKSAFLVLVVGLGLLTIQSLLLILVLHWRIARPLHRLVRVADRLAEGERGLALAIDRRDELGDLARSFCRMDRAIATSEEELTRTLEALREREEHARALLTSAADAVVLLVDDRIAEVNPQAAALFDRPMEELIGWTLLDLAPAKQGGEFLSRTVYDTQRERAAAGLPVQYDWLARRGDQIFETEMSLARVDLPGTERLLAVIRDVSERNKLQRELRQIEKLESVGQLAGGIAHDFNNMLSGIMGVADILLLPDTPSARRTELTNAIVDSCERAGQLTRRLLSFARSSEALSTRIHLERILDDVLTLLERSIDRRITIEKDWHIDRALVLGDAGQLENAFLNLGLNARDAMPDGGTLHYEMDVVHLVGANADLPTGSVATGDYLRIRVSDTGTGIAPDHLPHIFEPFFTTKEVGKGTGLGLAAVYRAAKDHNGGLLVESRLGQGTTFTVFLPLLDEDHDHQDTIHTQPIRPLDGKRVLIVDDEDVVRRVAAQMLSSMGCLVSEAADGIAGLAAFRAARGAFDVVLLDAEMPGLRGPDCLRQMREIALVPTVLCSGFIRHREGEELRHMGFAARLDKPFRITALRQCIEKLLYDGHR